MWCVGERVMRQHGCLASASRLCKPPSPCRPALPLALRASAADRRCCRRLRSSHPRTPSPPAPTRPAVGERRGQVMVEVMNLLEDGTITPFSGERFTSQAWRSSRRPGVGTAVARGGRLAQGTLIGGRAPPPLSLWWMASCAHACGWHWVGWDAAVLLHVLLLLPLCRPVAARHLTHSGTPRRPTFRPALPSGAGGGGHQARAGAQAWRQGVPGERLMLRRRSARAEGRRSRHGGAQRSTCCPAWGASAGRGCLPLRSPAACCTARLSQLVQLGVEKDLTRLSRAALLKSSHAALAACTAPARPWHPRRLACQLASPPRRLAAPCLPAPLPCTASSLHSQLTAIA